MHEVKTWFGVLLAALVLTLGASVVSAPWLLSGAQAAPPRQRPRRPAPPPKPVKPDPKTTPVEAPAVEPTLQRSNRMELDARLVRGESARSGAVYLFQRAPRRLPPLVDLHQSYLDEIVVPVLGEDTSASAAPVVEDAPTKPAEPTTPAKHPGGR